MKIQDFNGIWARDLAIPLRRSSQLSYEATDVGSGHLLWGAVCKKNYLEQICDIFSYLEIIKTARKFIYK